MSDTLLTPVVTLAHPNLFRAKLRKNPKPTDRPKYSLVALFSHESLESPEYKALVAAVEAAGKQAWGAAAFATMLQEGTFKGPFRREIASKGYDATKFARFISCDSGEDYPPRVLIKVGNNLVPITDPAMIYPGVQAVVSVSVRTFGGPGTEFAPGAKLDLRNVLKWADGDRLAGSGATGDEFAGMQPPAASAPSAADTAALLA